MSDDVAPPAAAPLIRISAFTSGASCAASAPFFYSINTMRKRHPAWFQEDLGRLLGMLASGDIRPRVAERLSFDQVAEAHRRIEAGGLKGKLVLCPELPSGRDGVPGAAPLSLPAERSCSRARLLW